MKIKPKEPEPYKGERVVKILENFCYDMTQYLTLARITDAKDQVLHTSTFLADDAKLWWCNYKADQAKGCNTFEVNSWEDLQSKLRIQFLPSNIEWKARDALHNLRHVGRLREFIKAHNSLCYKFTT